MGGGAVFRPPGHPPSPQRLQPPPSLADALLESPSQSWGVAHAPHLLAPGPGHPPLLESGPCSRDFALVWSWRHGGADPPEAALSALWLRGRGSGARRSSEGLGRAARRGEGSGAGGWEERGGSPGLSALEVTQLEPRLVLQASIHLHSRVHWLIHILSILRILTLPPPRIQHAQGVESVGGPQSRGGPHLYLLPHLTD